MNYREQFEQKEKKKVEVPEELSLIVEKESKSQPAFDSQTPDGLMGLGVLDVDHLGSTLAFILYESYSVSDQGIRNSSDFGILRGGELVRHGWSIYQGARASELDNWAANYRDVKILEETVNGVVFGVESSQDLSVYRWQEGTSGFTRIEHHDLEAERVKKASDDLQIQAEATEELAEKMDLFGKQLKVKYNAPQSPWSKVLQCGDESLGLLSVELYDRDYDPSIRTLHFYIVEEGASEAKHAFTRHPSYDTSYKRSARFFMVGASKTIPDVVEEIDGVVNIPVQLQIGGRLENRGMGLPPYQQFGVDDFVIEYALEGNQDV